MKMQFSLIFVLLIISTHCYSSSQKLIGGLSTHGWKSTIKYFHKNGSSCSAVKIGTYRFLTAAHCVINLKTGETTKGFDKGSVIYLTNVHLPNANSDWQAYTFSNIILHQSYQLEVKRRAKINKATSGSAMTSFDIAVFTINERSSHLPISEVDFTPVETGDIVTTLGYGCEKSVNTPTTEHIYGRKKMGKGQVLGIDTLYNHPTYKDYYLKNAKEIMHHNILVTGPRHKTPGVGLCPGDSGGPTFRDKKVIGVNAYYTFIDKSGLSYTNLETRISNLRDWNGWQL